jgi:hypothetical protein
VHEDDRGECCVHEETSRGVVLRRGLLLDERRHTASVEAAISTLVEAEYVRLMAGQRSGGGVTV